MSTPSLHPAPHHWVGLCCITESNQPHEWPYIAWVIRNRLDSGKYKHSYEQVVLQSYQFSAFNKWIGQPDPLVVFRMVARGYHWIEYLFHACDAAKMVIEAPRSSEPFPITVRHYYSPRSMRPLGSKPAWEKEASRLFTPEGVSPERFIFADNVKP